MSHFTSITSRPAAAAATTHRPPKMPSSLPEVEQAFADQPELKKRVYSAIEEQPSHQPLFTSISSYILQLRQAPPPSTNGAAVAEPAAKKRKLEGSELQKGSQGDGMPAWADSHVEPAFSFGDVSFSVPQRKKFRLELVGKANGSSGIRAVLPNGDEPNKAEFGIAFRDIEQIFCLPVPEKPKRQWNFVVIPKNNDGVNPTPSEGGTQFEEQMVWTFQEPTAKEKEAGAEPGPEKMAETLSTYLKASQSKAVVSPTKDEFQSAIPQSHRKGEPGFHVKAFRGSKDGYLFFTNAGIIFAFKKPLVYFSFASIDSVSYTSVLQRTFNLNITTSASEPDQKPQEIEFSMLDQADYTGIDQYIKRHGLNDASMAAQRRAQKYNVNGPPVGKDENGGDEEMAEEDDGETELQKAERMLEDEEDEDEEDYNPGSEGESEGSGSSSDEEEDDDEGDEEGGEEGEDDLVREELGSEAEDVEITDEE